MFRIEQRCWFAPLFCHRPVTGRFIDGVLAEKLSRLEVWLKFKCPSTGSLSIAAVAGTINNRSQFWQ